MKNNEGRVLVWFSCGAASACAAKLAVQQYEHVEVVYCDTLASEHPDNKRFFKDVEEWTGKSIQIISSEKYKDVDDVFEKRRYMSGIAGAPCTTELKKIPRLEFQRPNDLHIFGLTFDEQKRIERFEDNNPDLELDWILREHHVTKEDCYAVLKEASIDLPIMYSLGFKNNNCLGCVKATSPVYWYRIKEHFPDVFRKRAKQSRAIGCRLTRYKGKRVFLDELPDTNSDFTAEQDIECGPICVSGENDLIRITT